MKLEFKNFESIDPIEWDTQVLKKVKNLNYQHYFITYNCITWNRTNIGGLFLNEDKLAAIFILYLNNETNAIVSPIPIPIIAEGFGADSLMAAKTHFALEIPNGIKLLNDDWQIEPEKSDLDLATKQQGFNMIMDLRLSHDELYSNLDRNHKRNIRKSLEQNQEILIINNQTRKELIDLYFNLYRSCHRAAAGRQTRNNNSFDYMLKLIHSGISTLFVTVLSETPISFLYCDSTGELARGWSQATSEQIQKDIFPRTLLEWSAISYYKKEGCKYYHLGSYESEKPIHEFPDLGFMEFKRRFRPVHLPITQLNYSEL